MYSVWNILIDYVSRDRFHFDGIQSTIEVATLYFHQAYAHPKNRKHQEKFVESVIFYCTVQILHPYAAFWLRCILLDVIFLFWDYWELSQPHVMRLFDKAFYY